MRSAVVASFTLVTVTVFSTTVIRVFAIITHLRQTVRVGSLVEITQE
jgi:hypothetical protein